MTIVTAHSGAEGTAPNSYEFLKMAAAAECEAFEVDVRIHAGEPYISHGMKLFGVKKCPNLYDVFSVAKESGKSVNCDLKEGLGSLRALNRIAEEVNAVDNLIFTGNYKSRFYNDLKFGQVFLNGVAIAKEYGLKMTAENLPVIKKLIEDAHNPNIVGLNFNYSYFNENLAVEADRLGLKLSVFTVQDETVYRELLRCGVYNITTLTPSAVIAARNELLKQN